MPTVSTHTLARRAAVALGLALSFGACKEFTSIDASFANVTGSETLYALNGSPPGSANALKFFDGIANRADQGFGYDVAFDIDAAGNVVIIPARALATNFSNPYSVGLQKVAGSFESNITAPKDGFTLDTAIVVGLGQTVIAETHDSGPGGVCSFSLKGQSYFTKLVVTEIDQARRRITFTFTVNRNCGFRSFALGIPRD
ncbi:MAG: hypothetical protein ABIR92_07640 [Gemmatimonadaceae bacterium]